MADILAALDQLDKQEKKQQSRKPTSGRGRPPASTTSSYESRRTTRAAAPSRPRPVSLPASPTESAQTLAPPPATVTTPRSVYAVSERSPSQGPDSRRISFADPPRPSARRLRIPTRTENLASGFPFDPRLNKYGVSEDEWNRFSQEIVDAADVPGPSWAWSFQRKNVTKRIKKELQYEGELKRLLRRWNKGFRMKRFQVWLELPTKDESSLEVLDGEDEYQARRDARRFRMMVMQNVDKAPSVYSRSSSLTRSVSGEAATAIAKRTLADAEDADATPRDASRDTSPVVHGRVLQEVHQDPPVPAPDGAQTPTPEPVVDEPKVDIPVVERTVSREPKHDAVEVVSDVTVSPTPPVAVN